MSEPALNRKFVEMMKLLNIYINHFPAHEKYALSSQIRKTAYELYDFITEGQKRYYKKTTLTNLDINHEKLRMQIYLAYELGYFNFKDGRRSKKNIEKKIKDRRFVGIMMSFAEMETPVGIPIGNLLSQIYALIFMNPVDHFVKRVLKVKKYVRYVDDFIMIGITRTEQRLLIS